MAKKINNFNAQNHKKIKMLLSLGNGEVEELISYVELNDIVSKMIDDEEANPNCPFISKGIISHEGPLSSKHKNYKGSKFNVKVQWEDGSITFEPLTTFGKNDPITCAIYAKDNNLLETDDWKFLCKYA